MRSVSYDAASGRDWNKDGRVLTVEDARQVVEAYHQAYSRKRFRWLMVQAAAHGHPAPIAEVFRSAIPME